MEKMDIVYHEKSKAWRIMRPIHLVHLTGGSWYYPWCFKSYGEALELVNERNKKEEEKGNA